MKLSLRRLSHGAPSPARAAWIAAKCPGLVELRSQGCTQLTPESLQGFSQAALEVRPVHSPCLCASASHRQLVPCTGQHFLQQDTNIFGTCSLVSLICDTVRQQPDRCVGTCLLADAVFEQKRLFL